MILGGTRSVEGDTGSVWGGTWWYWGSIWWYWLIYDGWVSTGRCWMILGGTGSVEGGTGWHLVVPGQYDLVLLIKCHWVSKRQTALMPVYIEKGGDLVGCHHSGTTNKQG